MNLRALALLFLLLLTQAGSALAGACERAVPAQQCPHECCAPVVSTEASLQEAGSGCACIQSSQESQAPAPIPVVPASSGRDLASQQTVWHHMALADLWLGSQAPREFHPVEAGRMEVVKPLYAVPVQVLHCAFLI